MGTLISEKGDYKPKLIRVDKEGYFILVKETVQEDIMITNIYVANISALNYIK